MSDKIKTYEELEHTAKLKLDIANAEREKDLATKNHEKELKQISSGYDAYGNKLNCSVSEKINLMADSSREYIKNYDEHNEELLSIGTEVDDEEEEITVRKTTKVSKPRKNKHRWLINTFVGAATVLALGTTAVTAIYCNHEGKVDAKTEKYADDLEKTVDDSTYSRIGNLVYQNGKVVETLDEDQTANHEYQYIDYNNIADYIETSDDPDLATFTFFKCYGRSSNPEHHRIVTKTFKYLEFEGSELGSEDNFSKYLEENGFESYQDYYRKCREELYKDDDDRLDNIKYPIKKKTLN